MPVEVVRFLHLLFAFYFVGAGIVAEWNLRAMRSASGWAERAILAETIRRALLFAGLGSLLALGVLGNLLAPMIGYRMAADRWMHVVNGVWLVAVVVLAAFALPAASRLAALARGAAGGGAPDGWDGALGRFRLANAIMTALFLALLALMVFRWRS